MARVYVGTPGEGKPIKWKSGPKRGDNYVLDRDNAQKVVHFVDDAGRPIPEAEALRLRDNWVRRTSEPVEAPAAAAAPMPARVAEAPSERRGSFAKTAFWGSIAWVVLVFAAGASLSVGQHILMLVLTPLFGPLFGYGFRAFFFFLR
jgi:hypothetical protein